MDSSPADSSPGGGQDRTGQVESHGVSRSVLSVAEGNLNRQHSLLMTGSVHIWIFDIQGYSRLFKAI